MTAVQETQQLAATMVKEMRAVLASHGKAIRIMEVCGTHTVAIFRAGLRQILPEGIELVSGPGCPVCVTADDYIDAAIAYAGMADVIITTFGDMLKVPGRAQALPQRRRRARMSASSTRRSMRSRSQRKTRASRLYSLPSDLKRPPRPRRRQCSQRRHRGAGTSFCCPRKSSSRP